MNTNINQNQYQKNLDNYSKIKQLTNKLNVNEKSILRYINTLPEELVELIKEYIPYVSFVFVNKDYYNRYHYLFSDTIKPRSELYIRSMIRQDNDYVVNKLFYEFSYHWLSMRNYYHKDCIYMNYLYFLLHYSIDNDSKKCVKLLNHLIKELGLVKNQHKKKTIRYIRWKT
uniref:Uncharacterized protein n=1 Tax=viral metagenome TaxID=1070528 RepID=A0A6C0IRA7_9ZZZZ